MTWTRRHMLQLGGAAIAAAALPTFAETRNARGAVLKPGRLKEGDVVGLVSPSGATFFPDRAEVAREGLAAMGLEARFGEPVPEGQLLIVPTLIIPTESRSQQRPRAPQHQHHGRGLKR